MQGTSSHKRVGQMQVDGAASVEHWTVNESELDADLLSEEGGREEPDDERDDAYLPVAETEFSMPRRRRARLQV